MVPSRFVKATRRQRRDYPHLSDSQFSTLILRKTEPPGTSLGTVNTRPETFRYKCPNCGNDLFSSTTKFSSGSGWPAFYDCLDVKEKTDYRILEDGHYVGLRREVVCGRCRAHLGHVFKNENWATPSGVRYCINSSSITSPPSTAGDGRAG